MTVKTGRWESETRIECIGRRREVSSQKGSLTAGLGEINVVMRNCYHSSDSDI